MRLVELDEIFERMDLGVFRRLEIFVEVVLEVGHYFVNSDHPSRGDLLMMTSSLSCPSSMKHSEGGERGTSPTYFFASSSILSYAAWISVC